MVPNVKVALLLSMASIGTVSWVVTHISRESTQLVLQFIPQSSFDGRRVAGATARREMPTFAHDNVFEREARLSPSGRTRLQRHVSANSPRVRMYLPPMRSLGRGSRLTPAGGGGVVRLVQYEAPRGPRSSGRMLAARTAASARTNVEPVARAHVPDDPRPQVAESRESSTQPLGEYVVRSGDTLVGIARRMYGSGDAAHIAALVLANSHLKNSPDRIFAGQALVIPVRGAVISADAPAGAFYPGGSGPAAEEAGGKTKPPRLYTIRKGDSLISIARRLLNNGSRWREILALNRSLRADRPIHAGVRIRVPEA